MLRFVGGMLIGLVVIFPAAKSWAVDTSKTPYGSVGKLLATLDDPAASNGDSFGGAVDITGNTAIVGAPTRRPAGAAYLYVRTTAGWPTTPTAILDNPTGDPYFGLAVAVSGDWALVGDPYADSGAGAVYVYQKGPTVWKTGVIETLEAPKGLGGGQFGSRIAMSFDAALISSLGGPADAAFIFDRSASSWSREPVATFRDPAHQVNDAFGDSLSLAPNFAVVGAPGNDSYRGSAYVYSNNSSGWSAAPEVTLDDPAYSPDDYFGDSVSVSEKTLLVGARGKNPQSGGEAYIYESAAEGWTTTPTATIEDPVSGSNFFGYAVALSGGAALVGAPGTNDDSGAVYVYLKGASGWSTVPDVTLAISGTFAGTTAASDDIAIIGSLGAGKAFVYRI